MHISTDTWVDKPQHAFIQQMAKTSICDSSMRKVFRGVNPHNEQTNKRVGIYAFFSDNITCIELFMVHYVLLANIVSGLAYWLLMWFPCHAYICM